MPPHLDELEKVYLWELQAFGTRPGPFIGVTAGFGDNGDLRRSQRIMQWARESRW